MANLVIDTTTKSGYFTIIANTLAEQMRGQIIHVAFQDLADARLTPSGDAVQVIFKDRRPDAYITMGVSSAYMQVDTLDGLVPASNAALAASVVSFVTVGLAVTLPGVSTAIRQDAQTVLLTALQTLLTSGPLYTVENGDTGVLSATLTTAILGGSVNLVTYTNATKSLYVTGYSLSCASQPGTVYFGKSPIGTVPANPGALNSGPAYKVPLSAGEEAVHDFTIPIKVCAPGETFLVECSPGSILSTTWTVFVYVVLR